MKLYLTMSFLVCLSPLFSENITDSLLLKLDKTLENHHIYERRKVNRIDSLKQELSRTTKLTDQYRLNNELFENYKAYRYDSASSCIERNIEIASRLKAPILKTEARLHYSFILSTAGLYKESMEILSPIDKNILPEKLRQEYYARYAQVYNGLRNYIHESTFKKRYHRYAEAYKDSLILSLKMNSVPDAIHLSYLWGTPEEHNQWYPFLMEQFRKVSPGTHQHAMIAFKLSEIYANRKDSVNRERYLILSATSDIQSAIKDNASLRHLAVVLFHKGEIGKAYTYIKYSLDDANFYNARQRILGISKLLPLIEKSYQIENQRHKKNLERFAITVSLLSLCLLCSLLFIFKQMKKISRTGNELKSINKELRELNRKLSESNLIKEEYISQFINMCSTYIEKLENYQNTVNRKLLSGQTEEVIRMTQSKKTIQSELKEFYTRFDEVFLKIYPDFVSKFNNLLNPGEEIRLKEGELLNTELRIFALIRLGITDSSRIAQFLRYSVNSIYTYRTKIRNKAAVPRDDFENYVSRIGVSSSS